MTPQELVSAKVQNRSERMKPPTWRSKVSSLIWDLMQRARNIISPGAAAHIKCSTRLLSDVMSPSAKCNRWLTSTPLGTYVLWLSVIRRSKQFSNSIGLSFLTILRSSIKRDSSQFKTDRSFKNAYLSRSPKFTISKYTNYTTACKLGWKKKIFIVHP